VFWVFCLLHRDTQYHRNQGEKQQQDDGFRRPAGVKEQAYRQHT